MRDFMLTETDRAFRAGLREFLQRELAPRAAGDRGTGRLGRRQGGRPARSAEAGYLKLMFRDLYRGDLAEPGLTHATLLSEEAGRINYALRDDDRHRPELCLSAAPPCDGGNARAIPARHRRGPDDRGDLRDRARCGLRHLADTDAGRVRRRPPRMRSSTGRSATSRTRRSPTSTSSMA